VEAKFLHLVRQGGDSPLCSPSVTPLHRNIKHVVENEE